VSGAGSDTLFDGAGSDIFVVQASDGVGTDIIFDFFDNGDLVDLVGLTVSSGLNSATVLLNNGSTIVSGNGHLREANDFV
jgi:Ca2+-binding RTX toxin-like protein